MVGMVRDERIVQLYRNCVASYVLSKEESDNENEN